LERQINIRTTESKRDVKKKEKEKEKEQKKKNKRGDGKDTYQ
jgi:hypothetical protein